MQWRAQGIVVAQRQFGENKRIVEVFSADYGRVAGLLRTAKRQQALAQLGVGVQARWRARLAEHLGNYELDYEAGLGVRANALSREALLALQLLCVHLREMPEREPHQRLYAATTTLLPQLVTTKWMSDFVRWELLLLEELGFGLDLSCCAVTGATENLVFVSPNSGRAVSAQGAGEYAPRLLALPAFLRDPSKPADSKELEQGFALLAYFLRTRLYEPHGRSLPVLREDLCALLL